MRKSYIIFSLLLASGLSAVKGMDYKEPNSSNAKRKQNVRYKAETCLPATQASILAFNSVDARIENGGNMWLNRQNNTAAYEVPKGGGVRSIFAGALWLGGYSETGQLKLAAVTFRSNGNDFWPGPLEAESATTEDVICAQYDKFWSAYKPDAQLHDAWAKAVRDPNIDDAKVAELFPDYPATMPAYFNEWPGNYNGTAGNYDKQLAPFKDWNQDGVYDPNDGDYPGYALGDELNCRDEDRFAPLYGDTTVYWIFNDKGNVHTESGGSEPIGMEVRAQAFSFASEGPINNMTFYNYVLINQGTQTLDSTFFGQWLDTDLGNPTDDYVGCDVQRGLGYTINGDETDDVTGSAAPGYGATPPALGVDFFQGPYQDADGIDNPGPYDEILAPFGFPDSTSDADKYRIARDNDGIPYLGLGIGYGDSIVDNERFGMRKFVYYNNTGSGANPAITDPQVPQDYYNFLSGSWRDGSRMLYGGNAHSSSAGTPPTGADLAQTCDFMFPGTSDPVGFGTNGRTGLPEWTEVTAENAPQDRRFMQSAGPFRLLPGAVNNITVGVVWARASQGRSVEASRQEMLVADDIAQSLFDNCFKIFEGPDAPDIRTVELDQEIILILDNPSTSNNFNEQYSQIRSEIPEIEGIDRTYEFEGYLVYQVRDPEVTVAELADETKARLIAQTDIRNYEIDTVSGEPDLGKPIGNMVNWVFDPDLQLPVPTLMVNNAPNGGIKKTFRVTQDAFAEGNPTLVNNKQYYFVALAYGYNNWQDYNPTALTGQAQMYVPSRKNGRGGGIVPVTAIPRTTESYLEVKVNANYGDAFPVTRLQGVGTSDFFLEIEDETRDAILANNAVDQIKYKKNAGPISVKIIDPLAITDGEFELHLVDTLDDEFNESGRWVLTNLATGEVYNSETTLDLAGEQIIPEYGISVDVKQYQYFGTSRFQKTELSGVGATITYADPTNPWLSGVSDQDGQSPQNWIRAGSVDEAVYGDHTNVADNEQAFEALLNGTWTAFGLASCDGTAFPEFGGVFPSGWRNSIIDSDYNKLAGLTNVNIVFTPNKDLWTRCIVLEMSDSSQTTEGQAAKACVRQAPSVDKNGNYYGTAEYDGDEIGDGLGMGWFPGYAIDVETGMRLNMMFGEASAYPEHNGNDMLWNPTDVAVDQEALTPGEAFVFGGRHYVMVMKPYLYRLGRMQDADDNEWLKFAKYDSCKTIMNAIGELAFRNTNFGGEVYIADAAAREVFRKGNWIGLPTLSEGAQLKSLEEGLIPNEATIKLRVKKQYKRFPTVGNELGDVSNTDPINPYAPKYFFSTSGFQSSPITAEDYPVIMESLRAVPNPYYAYYEGEESRLENKIQLVNLPNECTISIFALDGTRVRTFKKANDLSILDWDLKNEKGIPISSGVYLIHVNAPKFGEKVIRWFGVTRQVDLQSL